MTETIDLDGIAVDVERKNIKNIRLSVYPPAGKVQISAPSRISLETIRVFAITKLGWIKKQQEKLRKQEREHPRENLDRDSHYVWGKSYLLKVIEKDMAPQVDLIRNTLLLQVRPGSSEKKKQAVLEEWHREQLKAAVSPLITKWEPLMGVKVKRFFVQRMKTKWGSCHPVAGNIRLNSELAKKPRVCLEFIVVHEMVHLIEPTHKQHFIALMDRFMPRWQFYQDMLNHLPVSYE